MGHEVARGRLFTRRLALLALLMALAAPALVARFAWGLGAATNLSDNYPWGLWIALDLVWTALAAGAYATAGIVYVFLAEDFRALVRPAVWMGFLSYAFVLVLLLVDLSLPWHSYQLVLQVPENSAMYELSWCVAFYITVLALECAPTVFERCGWTTLYRKWRTWSPPYIVAVLSLFILLMSHSPAMAGVALVVFAAIAFITRDSYERGGVPIIVIVAAVTFSAMQQSSLGALFLLMPDKMSPLWWSPILPLHFFLSSVASGFAFVMLMDFAISYLLARPYRWHMMARMGKVLCGVLAVGYGLRIVDIVLRGQTAAALSDAGDATLFLIEVTVGGIVPAAVLAVKRFRESPALLVLSALLTLGGVVMNRLNVTLLGLNLPGTLPGGLVGTYVPTLVEWALSVSLAAAAVFMFGIGVKLLPILPKLDE